MRCSSEGFSLTETVTLVQPHYEKVARLFNGPDAIHPGIVLMTRVDCAMKVLTSCS